MDSTWASLFIPHRSVVLLESFEGLCLRIYHILTLTSSMSQAKTIQDHLRRDPTELCDTYTHNSPPQCFLIILSRCFSWCTWAARGNIKGQWRRVVIWAFFCYMIEDLLDQFTDCLWFSTCRIYGKCFMLCGHRTGLGLGSVSTPQSLDLVSSLCTLVLTVV